MCAIPYCERKVYNRDERHKANSNATHVPTMSKSSRSGTTRGNARTNAAPYNNKPFKCPARTLPTLSDIERILERLDKLVREVESVSMAIVSILPEHVMPNDAYADDEDLPDTQSMEGDTDEEDLDEMVKLADEAEAAHARSKSVTGKSGAH